MYDLEIDKAVNEIKRKKCRKVLIQLPDGLKNKADEIVNEIEDKTKAEVLIWLGSCYGQCDTPLGIEGLGIDLVITWGHGKFVKEW